MEGTSAMDMGEVAEAIGQLRARTESLEQRLDAHADEDMRRHDRTMAAIAEIKDMLSQATGARKLLVWILGILIAAIALAKGWIFGGKP